MIKYPREDAVMRIRNILQDGGHITICGWHDSDHNPQTREYAKTGRIIFLERKKKIVGLRGDLVFFTRCISDDEEQQMHGKYNIYPGLFQIPTIISILTECGDLIVKKETQKTVESFDFYGVNPGPVPED